MKAKDLRLGDFVVVGGNTRRVVTFDEDFVVVGNGEKWAMEDVEPCRLTREFLVKHKFIEKKEAKETYYVLGIPEASHVLVREDGDSFRVTINNGEMIFAGFCFYAHEIQHAMDACYFICEL